MNPHVYPIHMSCGYLLSYLIHKEMVEPKSLRPLTPPYPYGVDVNSNCEFHDELVGNTVESCRAFKIKVQELIDKKLLTLKEEDPSVMNNPSPG